MIIDLHTLAGILGGTLMQGDDRSANIEHSSIDSRTCESGGIFFCIHGTHHNGHEYIDTVAQKGAAVAVGEERLLDPPLPYIYVDDTIKAMGILAQYKRRRYKGLVIAITGSAGKTTFKECLSDILATVGTVAKNTANHNNQLGLALTILTACEDADIWVLELGISKPHDMFELGSVAEPNIVYITNTTNAHTQYLADRGVPYYKSVLFHYIPAYTTMYRTKPIAPAIFCPSTEHDVLVHAKEHPYALYTPDTHYTVEFLGVDPATPTHGTYAITHATDTTTVTLPFLGKYFSAILAGLRCVTAYLGIEDAAFCKGITAVHTPEKRAHIHQEAGSYIIDDTYNANPLSMQAMLDMAFSLPVSHVILLLGSMAELGVYSEEEHYALGKSIALLSQNKKTLLYWKGTWDIPVEQALSHFQYKGTFLRYPTAETLEKTLYPYIQDTFVFLAKASRSVHLEHDLPHFYKILRHTDTV